MPAPSAFAPFLDPLERLALPSAFPEVDYYVPPEEIMREAVAHNERGMFNLVHHKSQFKADIYLAARDPLHAWALEHRRRIDLAGDGAWIAPPEYVILRKLEFLREGGSDKHLRDIRFILAATAVNRAFIESEVVRRDLRTQWLQAADGI
jgi:hypothetical protein